MCCIEDEVGGTSLGWGKIRIPFQTCWLDLPSTTEWDIKKEVLIIQTFHCTHKLAKELRRRAKQKRENQEGVLVRKKGEECVSGRMELSVQFSSVAQSCLTLCDPVNRSMPGLPVHHQLPEFTQTHVHWVSDAIQPSHPRSSPSPPAPSPSQHQSLFQWVNSSHQVAKVLEFQL